MNEIPNLPKCPHNARVWNMDAPTYQTRLWCDKHKMFVSPAGVACVLCLADNFPHHRIDLRDCAPCKKKMLEQMKVQSAKPQ